MKQFHIIDVQGNVVPMETLNEQANKIWEEMLALPHVTPFPKVTSWSGFMKEVIENATAENWHSVTLSMCTQPIVSACIDGIHPRLDAYTLTRMRESIDRIQPYLKLMQFWAMKGYQPRKN